MGQQMINSFESLIEIAKQAEYKRLNKKNYTIYQRRARSNYILFKHQNKSTIKSVFAKFSLFRYMNNFRHTSDYDTAYEFSEALISDIITYQDEYNHSYNLLSDEQRKRIFENLLAGAMLLDFRYAEPYTMKKNKGGYNVELPGDCVKNESFIRQNEIFVDCGAFTGDTLQELIDFGIKPKKYIGFEPYQKSYIKARELLFKYNVPGVVYNVGVSNFNGINYLKINPNGPAANEIDSVGEMKIDVLSLDEAVSDEKVTFVKMDIEGHEYNAIEGAASILNAENKPRLAICIYHKPTDYRMIPLLIKRINPSYSKFYIRYMMPYYEKGLFGEVVLFVR
jgi:FkbM family methyltransferase